MKGMDLLCSSPASTAVISGMHAHRSTVRRRSRKSCGLLSPVPCSCSSLSPINPRPSYEEHRKSSSADKQNHELVRRKSYVKLNNLYTTHCKTASSSTHLLADSDSNVIHSDHTPALPSSSSSSSPRSRHQVVVLRVSLHCKGCAAKVGKHISRMQGVTSFSIDVEAKKVTIVGDVTPVGVLASVSKVKNAQLWPSSSSASSSVVMVGV